MLRDRHEEPQTFIVCLRHVLSHGAITLLAIGVAFALPYAAQYILYSWWPKVEADSYNLLATEIAVASLLVFLFNLIKLAWDNRRHVDSARLASLVYARNPDHWTSRWVPHPWIRNSPTVQDISVMTVSGRDTFVDKSSPLRPVMEFAYEIRVMLVNPRSQGARGHGSALRRDVAASVAFLRSLRRSGRKVRLKFYDHAPFWNIAVVGDHARVQYCHGGSEAPSAPEYVFALNSKFPARGLFVPFYMHFVEKWNESWHPEYDFDTDELVYRSGTGVELKRLPLALDALAAEGTEPELPVPPVARFAATIVPGPRQQQRAGVPG